MAPSLSQRLGDLFELDTRSLALCRIGLGLLVALDAALRFPDLVAFLTDDGAVPRYAVLAHLPRPWRFSLYNASGSWLWAGLLLVAQIAAGCLLAVGLRARVATFTCWVLVASVQTRNPVVMNGGDDVLRLALFWAMFLPLGARASLDASSRLNAPRSARGLAPAFYILQIASVYVFAFFLKDGDTWSDGTAGYYALNADQLTRAPVAAWLLARPALVSFGTHVVRWLELLGPLALLLPFRTPLVRIGVVGAFTAFHLGLFMTFSIGIFPLICIAVWSALLPGALWDRLGVARGGLPPTRVGAVGGIVASTAMTIAMVWNFSGLSGPDHVVPAHFRHPGHLLHVGQRWSMFTPNPVDDDGWFVVPAKRRDGQEIDLLTGTQVSWDKPSPFPMTERGQRWRKYARSLWEKRTMKFRAYYGYYLCRIHNQGVAEDAPERIDSLAIYFVKELTVGVGDIEPPKPIKLWDEPCGN